MQGLTLALTLCNFHLDLTSLITQLKLRAALTLMVSLLLYHSNVKINGFLHYFAYIKRVYKLSFHILLGIENEIKPGIKINVLGGIEVVLK